MATDITHPPKKLTQLGVNQIKPPGEGRAMYPDLVVPGLALRVSHSGLKSYTMLVRFGPAPVRVDCGRHGKELKPTRDFEPITTLKDARERAREAMAAASNNIDPRARKREEKAPASDVIDDVVKDFIRLYKGRRNKPLRPRTKEENERVLDNRIVPNWKGRSMATIRRREIIDFLDELAVDTPALANRTQGVITTLFDWALDREIIDANPATRLRAPAEKVKRDRALSDADIKTTWEVWEAIGYPWGDLQKLLLLTGQRREEVSAMSWPEIDLDEKEWTVPAERTKSDRENIVPLSKQAIAVLKNVKRLKGDYVFSTGNGEKHVKGYSKAKRQTDDAIAKLVKSGKAKKVEPWRWHDLRRTLKTGMSKLRVSEFVSELVLNHAMPGLEGVYNIHSYEEEKREALQTWANYVDGVIGKRPSNVTPIRKAKA